MDTIRKAIQDNLSDRKNHILKSFVTTNDIEVIQKSQMVQLDSAVAIIIKDGKVLLGMADADDDRDGKWCFPGGGIDSGEDSMSAAIREAYEEMGVMVKPIMQLRLVHPTKPKVAFHIMTCEDETVIMNEEFTDYKWCPVNSLPENILPVNKEIMEFVKK